MPPKTPPQAPMTPPRHKSRTRTIVAAVLIFVIGFATGGITIRSYFPDTVVLTGFENQDKGKAAKVDFGLFWDVFGQIEEKFFGRNSLDYQKMLFGAIQGMVSNIDDQYSEFFPPKESERFLEDVKGTFEGIGAEIDSRDGILTIVAPLEGMPAEKAGLQPLDRILKIDGESTEGISLEEAVDRIRGPRGTAVTLRVQRGPQNDEFDIEIQRGVIRVPILKLSFTDDNIAYLRLVHFSENSSRQFAQSVEEILKNGSNKLVLDLRNNPGGFLDEAVEIASYFLEEGETVTIEDFGNGKGKNFYRSRGYNQLGHVEVVVLVNGGSASASEILAGALRDIRSIKLIGDKTFGKGSVQEFMELAQNTSLKITVAKWLTPASHQIDGAGLEPDIEIARGEDPAQDPQLEKAYEVLRTDIIE